MKNKTIALCSLIIMLAGVVHFAAEGQQKNGATNSETSDASSSHGPDGSVRTIKQDSKGNMWIVSLDGIIRYDGQSFTNITSKVGSSRFWDVLEDRHGNFWFASIGSGVYYYDGKTFRNYTTKEGLASNMVFEIYEDKAGFIWFGTQEGASRYDGKSFRNFAMKQLPSPAHVDSIKTSYDKPFPDPSVKGGSFDDYWMINEGDDRIHTIFKDRTGKLWFGTWGDVRIYDGNTYTSLTKKYGETLTNVQSISEDKKGNIWLNGGSGLWRYDGSTFTKVAQRGACFMIVDKKGNLWTTEEVNRHEGVWALSRYDAKSLYDKKPTVTEIKSEYGLFGMVEARDGSIWFGSTVGVYRYDGKTVKRL